jgi:hypothetical protein
VNRGGTIALVALTVLAAPVALVFESVLRRLLMPPDFETVRSFLSPWMTMIAWILVGISAVAGVTGVVVQRAIVARRLAKLGAAVTPEATERVRNQVFLVTASIPQLPTILSTFAFMFGASWVPTWVGVAICTVSVLAQGFALWASAAEGAR